MQSLGGSALEQTRRSGSSILIWLAKVPWRRIVYGFVACGAWLVFCGLLAGVLLFLGGYERFPATVNISDYSADHVKLKGTDDLFLRIQATGRNPTTMGLTNLPDNSLRSTVQFSIFRVVDRDLQLNQSQLDKSGRADSDFDNRESKATRNVYSSEGFFTELSDQDDWVYSVESLGRMDGVTVPPQLLLNPDLAELNLAGLKSIGTSRMVVSAPVGLSSGYVYHPALRDSTPLKEWFRQTGLESADCEAYAAGLFELLGKLRSGSGELLVDDRDLRVVPIAALLDLDLFQPQATTGRLSIYVNEDWRAIGWWTLLGTMIAIAGCLAIVWRMTRRRR